MSALEQDNIQLNDNCPCKREKCPRYRNCEACKAHHGGRKKPPYCMREKSSKIRLSGI